MSKPNMTDWENNMLFCSIEFIFIFMPIFYGLYYLCPKAHRNVILFLGSLIFYAVGEWRYLPMLLAALLVNFLGGMAIGKVQHRYLKRFILFLTLLYNFGMLIWFKYLGFILINVQTFTGLDLGAWAEFSPLLPLGISFYTFQITSYVVDVCRGKEEPCHNLVDLGTYLCMFPQLIAGPIVLYSDIRTQLRKRSTTRDDILAALGVFILGLSAKMLLANVFGALFSEIHRLGFDVMSPIKAWMGAFAYTLQIYFDFWGYSLMAIGLGKLMGFDIPENFNNPYRSRSVTEFWRRWHITLSTWFRDYVYIPLGGSRKGRLRQVLNLFIVWFLTGFWHGAGWNFILWGMLFFVLLTIEKLGLLNCLERHAVLSRLYMIVIIPASWVIFAVEDWSELTMYLSRMFLFWRQSPPCMQILDFVDPLKRYGAFFFIALLIITPALERFAGKLIKVKFIAGAVIVALAGLSVWQIVVSTTNPFLYFRF